MLNLAPWLLELTIDFDPDPARDRRARRGPAARCSSARPSGRRSGDRWPSAWGPASSGIDRLAGAVLGAAQALLVIWLAGGLLAASPFRAARPDRLDVGRRPGARPRCCPPPTEVIGELATALDDSGLPDVFVGLEPFPAPGRRHAIRPRGAADRRRRGRVGGPRRDPGLRAAGDRDGVRRGAGLPRDQRPRRGRRVRDPRHRPRTASSTRRSSCSTPTSTSPSCYVPDVDGPSLDFADEAPDRGTTGAALGFAGGGPLVILPAGGRRGVRRRSAATSTTRTA